MSKEYFTSDELESALGYLASYVGIMRQYESLFADHPVLSAENTIQGVRQWEEWFDQLLGQSASITGDGDLSLLDDIPDRCRTIIELDENRLEEFSEQLSDLEPTLEELSGNPGNILNRIIGIWYGEAADAFEDYFSAYPSVIEHQTEIFLSIKNGAVSLMDLVIACKEAVTETITAANELAQEIIGYYEEHSKLMTEQRFLQVLVMIVAASSIAGASSAAGIAGTSVGAAGTLASAELAITRSQKSIEANDSESLRDAVREALLTVETGLDEIDTEVAEGIGSILDPYSLGQFAITEPPGSEDVDEDSFYYGR